jgi:hypothetical protein
MKNMKNMKYIKLLFLTFLFFSCQKDVQIGGGNTVGTGGSLARFAIVGDMMYIATTDSLKTYSIANTLDPRFVNGQKIGWNNGGDIETIFAFNNRLFVGSRTGLFLYSFKSGSIPKYEGQFQHGWGCDPVVANDSLAFVTIRNGNTCRGLRQFNQLDVLDVKDINYPKLLKSYPMTFPAGVGLDGKTLFVCDDGIRIFDISNPLSMTQLKYLPKLDALDVIPASGTLLIIGAKKMTQLDYRDLNNIKTLSEFDLR